MKHSALSSRPRPRRRALRLGVAALLAVATPLGLVAGGCTCSPTPGGVGAGASAAGSASVAAPSDPAVPTSRSDDEVRPVYPIDAGPPDPLAARFCEAVQALPERRRAECCEGARTGVAPMAACVRTLSYAIAQHAIAVEPAEVDACVAAMTRATVGCDWVTPLAVAIPPACTGILRGKLAEKERCRSSLECAAGLRCQGLSATDLGACGPPREARVQCGVGIDTLAAYTRQDRVDHDHPECEGRCARGQCADAIALGAECKSDSQCGKNRCVAGKCSDATLPVLGAACPASACAAGAGCVHGVCVAPKAEGEACSAHAECRGECVTEDGGAAGTCARRCASFALPVRLPPRHPR